MGAPSAQVQSPQSSQPASKGAGQSASSESGSGKGSGQLSAMSGQPRMGQPNTNGNTALAPVNAGLSDGKMGRMLTVAGGQNGNPNFVASNDGSTAGNPYSNTISAPYMPGIDPFGGQPQNSIDGFSNPNLQVGGPAQQVGGPVKLTHGMDLPAIGLPGGEGGKTTYSQPRGKGGGGGQGGGKGSTATGGRLVAFPQLAAPFDPNMAGKTNNDPLGLIENTYHPNSGPQGFGSNY